jgi:hypothetical protein
MTVAAAAAAAAAAATTTTTSSIKQRSVYSLQHTVDFDMYLFIYLL